MLLYATIFFLVLTSLITLYKLIIEPMYLLWRMYRVLRRINKGISQRGHLVCSTMPLQQESRELLKHRADLLRRLKEET